MIVTVTIAWIVDQHWSAEHKVDPDDRWRTICGVPIPLHDKGMIRLSGSHDCQRCWKPGDVMSS